MISYINYEAILLGKEAGGSLQIEASGRRLIVVEQTEMKDDLVQDMIDVLTSFCARLYGRRSAKNRAKKAIQAIDNAD